MSSSTFWVQRFVAQRFLFSDFSYRAFHSARHIVQVMNHCTGLSFRILTSCLQHGDCDAEILQVWKSGSTEVRWIGTRRLVCYVLLLLLLWGLGSPTGGGDGGDDDGGWGRRQTTAFRWHGDRHWESGCQLLSALISLLLLFAVAVGIGSSDRR